MDPDHGDTLEGILDEALSYPSIDDDTVRRIVITISQIYEGEGDIGEETFIHIKELFDRAGSYGKVDILMVFAVYNIDLLLRLLNTMDIRNTNRTSILRTLLYQSAEGLQWGPYPRGIIFNVPLASVVFSCARHMRDVNLPGLFRSCLLSLLHFTGYDDNDARTVQYYDQILGFLYPQELYGVVSLLARERAVLGIEEARAKLVYRILENNKEEIDTYMTDDDIVDLMPFFCDCVDGSFLRHIMPRLCTQRFLHVALKTPCSAELVRYILQHTPNIDFDSLLRQSMTFTHKGKEWLPVVFSDRGVIEYLTGTPMMVEEVLSVLIRKGVDDATISEITRNVPCRTLLHAAITGNIHVLEAVLRDPGWRQPRLMRIDYAYRPLIMACSNGSVENAAEVLRIFLDDWRVVPHELPEDDAILRAEPEILRIAIGSKTGVRRRLISDYCLSMLLKISRYDNACVLLRHEDLILSPAFLKQINLNPHVQDYDRLLCLFAIRGEYHVVSRHRFTHVFPEDAALGFNYLPFVNGLTLDGLLEMGTKNRQKLRIFDSRSIFRFELADVIGAFLLMKAAYHAPIAIGPDVVDIITSFLV